MKRVFSEQLHFLEKNGQSQVKFLLSFPYTYFWDSKSDKGRLNGIAF